MANFKISSGSSHSFRLTILQWLTALQIALYSGDIKPSKPPEVAAKQIFLLVFNFSAQLFSY